MDDSTRPRLVQQLRTWIREMHRVAEASGNAPSADHSRRLVGVLQEAVNRIIRLEAALREVIDPGVFGPWTEVSDPMVRLNHGDDIERLCELLGYGAVLHHVAYLWEQAHPKSAHTIAACASVRRGVIERIQKLTTTGEYGL